MSRDLRRSASNHSNGQKNILAGLLSGAAMACMYYSFEPAVAEDTKPVAVMTTTEVKPVIAQTIEADQVASLEDKNASLVIGSNETATPEMKVPEPVSENQANLNLCADYLKQGIQTLEEVESYSFVFTRQERLEGELQDPQQIEVKLRHAPFSVYMKWQTGDRGRELLFSDQETEGQLFVKLGGFKGRLLPTLKLDPLGDRAMGESRHPITDIGLKNLCAKLLDYRLKDLKSKCPPNCTIESGHQMNGRPCLKIVVEQDDPKESPIYRKCVTYVDEEWSLPVKIQNYTWPTETVVDVETETLIEHYTFTDIEFEKQIADIAWQSDNPAYRF